MILQSVIDSAANLEAPPDFEQGFMLIDEFNDKNMGAKSNNLKILKGKIEGLADIPESGCIPFKMCEYTLDLEPEIRD